MDSAWLASLREGDAEAWRRFLVDYYHIFRRAVGIGLWRLGRQATSAELRSLVVEAMGCCHQDLRESFANHSEADSQAAEHRGEGRFRAYLFYTVVKFLREQQEPVSGSVTSSEAEPRSGLRWRDDEEPAALESSLPLRNGLSRLPSNLRPILLFYHLEPAPPSLKEIAQVLLQDDDSVRESYRRGLRSLSALISDDPQASEEVESVERSLAQLRFDGADTGDRVASRAQVWRMAGGELDPAEVAKLEPQVAAHADTLLELAVADCLLADAPSARGGGREPLQARLEVADEVLRAEATRRRIRPFHWFVLAGAVLIGILMLFDDGQPVSGRVVAFNLLPLRPGQSPEAGRDCEFRLELSARNDRNVVVLLAHVVGGEGVVSRLFPLSPETRELAGSPVWLGNPIRLGENIRIPAAGASPFQFPWVRGMGVLVVSSDPAEVLSEQLIQGLLATARIILDRGDFEPATLRRMIKALIESAQHDSVQAYVHWIDLRAPPQ